MCCIFIDLEERNIKMEIITPSSITIMITFKCTAACEECCYQCSPKLKAKLSLDEIISYIEESKESFSHLNSVYFTGSECFLLGKDLIKAIEFSTRLGLATRCVTNGFWDKSKTKALSLAKELRLAGLKEINFSTGDDHQRYVPLESVLNAAIACSSEGIRSLIIVEGSEESNFKTEELTCNQELVTFNSKTENPVGVMQNVWISLKQNKKIKQPEKLYASNKTSKDFLGCENIFTNTGLDPYSRIVSCCGLTMQLIPELHEYKYEKGKLFEFYKEQFEDFIKIWIWVDGPEAILKQVEVWNPNLSLNNNITHPCQACLTLYKNKEVKQTISLNYQQVLNTVLFKYYLKLKTYEEETSDAKQKICSGETII